MTTFMIINTTGSPLIDVNSGGDHVDSLSYFDNVTLTTPELRALLLNQGVFATASGASEQLRLTIKRVVRNRST